MTERTIRCAGAAHRSRACRCPAIAIVMMEMTGSDAAIRSRSSRELSSFLPGRAVGRKTEVTCARRTLRSVRDVAMDSGAARASSGIVIDCLRHCYSLDGVGSAQPQFLHDDHKSSNWRATTVGVNTISELWGLHGD